MTEQSSEPNIGWTEALGGAADNPVAPRQTGETFSALGKEWKVSSCENRIKAQFEQWVRRNARKDIEEIESEEGPEAGNQLRSVFLADRGAGHYNWDGRHIRSARGDLPGLRQLLFLLLKRCQPDVTEQIVESLFRENPRGCGFAIRWALGNLEAPAETGPKQTTNGKMMTKEDWEKTTRTPVTLDSPSV